MAPTRIPRTVAYMATRTPGLKRLPMLKLLAVADVAMLTHRHVRTRLTPEDRRRAFELIRIGRGRTRNLSEDARDELASLIAKAEPRLLAGDAVAALSPLPLPRRLVYGRRGR